MLKYQISLINVFWSESDIDTRFFNSVDEQKAYFDDLSGGVYTSLLNFNMGDNVQTTITYRDNSDKTPEQLVKSNYAIVRQVEEDEDMGVEIEISRRYYYASCKQDSGRQMRVDLNLDDIQTNYIPFREQIPECLISRAHLNRWVENADGSISFDYSANSNLFENEQINSIAKRLKNRQRLNYYSSEKPEIANWLNEHIECWVYVMVDYTHGYNFITNTNTTQNAKLYNTIYNESESKSQLLYPNATLCFPVYKDNTTGYIRGVNLQRTQQIFIQLDALLQFLNDNSGYSYVKTIKLSLKPPFNFNDIGGNVVVNNGSLSFDYYDVTNYLASINQNDSLKYISFLRTKLINSDNNIYEGLIYLPVDYKDEVLFTTNIELPQIKFTKNEVINNSRKVKYNPKINAQNFKTLRLSFGGSFYDYPIDKLNTTTPIFAYQEALTLDVTKVIVRFKSNDDNNVFNIDYSKSINGLIYTEDLSLPIANNQLDLYLANNKNSYLSFASQQNYIMNQATLSSVSGALKSATSLDIRSIAGSAVDVSSTMLSAGMQVAQNSAQYGFTLDNMCNAPETLANANGNAIFNLMIAEFGLYAEIYEGLPVELNVSNDIMYLFGFTYNQFGKVADFDNIRKYFNFIQANIETIPYNISNKEKARLKSIFAGGVRFWNTDEIGFDVENYEQFLEEGENNE